MFDAATPTGKIPRLTGTKMLHQRQRFILGKHPDPGKSGIHDIAETKIDDPVNTAEGNRWLCPGCNKQVQATSHPSGEQVDTRASSDLLISTPSPTSTS